MVQRERAARPTPGGNRQDFFDMANLLRSGIYVPLGEALAMFYQVCSPVSRKLLTSQGEDQRRMCHEEHET